MSGLPGGESPLFSGADRHAWAAVLLAREDGPSAVWELLDGLDRDELAMLSLRFACGFVSSPTPSAVLRRALLDEAAS